MSTGISKIVAERNHRTLMELVLKTGNDVCADCKARAPRWASYNLGIFICVHCASIHRKIGTHITKVKSITLDEWSKEQVEVMKEKGNIRSNAQYNPDEPRNPPPTNMIDSERDSELEKFIRSKYEFKRFMGQKPRSTSQHLMVVPRSRSTPLTDWAQIERKSSPGPPLPPKTPENLPSKLRSLATHSSHNVAPTRSCSQPLHNLTSSDKLTAAPPLRLHAATQPSVEKPAGQVWEDLVSLQEPSHSSSFPLQYSPISPFPSKVQVLVQQHPTTFSNAPFLNLSPTQTNTTAPFAASPMSVSTPSPQFPFVSSAPFSNPTHQFSATNPFNQLPLAASTNATLSTSPNPFCSSSVPMVTTSMPTTPSATAMALPTATLLHTSLPFVAPQTFAPTPPQSLALGTAPATVAFAQNPFAPIGPPGQLPPGLPSSFPVMQMGHAGFSGTTPQPTFGTTALLSHHEQQQQLGPSQVGAWAAQSAQWAFQ